MEPNDDADWSFFVSCLFWPSVFVVGLWVHSILPEPLQALMRLGFLAWLTVFLFRRFRPAFALEKRSTARQQSRKDRCADHQEEEEEDEDERDRRADHQEEDEQDPRAHHQESAFVVLGIQPTASGQEIRQAYRSLAAKHHPDLFSEDEKSKAAELLARIHRAYQLIADVEDRFDYDLYIKSCWPFFPTLDESYTFVQHRRAVSAEMRENTERQQNADASRDREDAAPANMTPKKHAGDYQPFGQSGRTDGEQSESPAAQPGPETPHQPSRSSECPGCGEPYSIATSRNGVVHCERCGEELPQ